MITLHRIGHPNEELLVNHDMIVSVEANPDTVIRLAGGERIVVAEAPRDVADKMKACRAQVMSLAMLLSGDVAPPVASVGIGPRG
jgi:uncharacterized protein YlzI (FlbEa/FlbD family)